MSDLFEKEKEVMFNFIERNLARSPKDMDEGIGTVYERKMIDEYMGSLIDRFGISNLLESPADGVTGYLGINSLEIGRRGVPVTLANPSQAMLDAAKEAWVKKGLDDMVTIARGEVDALPFEDNSFDVVWNFCMFERFTDPTIMTNEMKRVSRRFVLFLTQNSLNVGTYQHYLYHRCMKQEWDHGRMELMRLGPIRKAMKDCGLAVVEEGALDTPPWMDTWDMPLRGEMKGLLSMFGKKWDWKSQEKHETEKPASESGVVDKLIWVEKNLPRWFNLFQTHHLYVLGEKKAVR
ncbi:MAG: class I SAM-dependent methyltransferase [Chloroflexi bacterium]|nr:class I SAM-dependent methyltransferase [Chloroflexota bacterium]